MGTESQHVIFSLLSLWGGKKNQHLLSEYQFEKEVREEWTDGLKQKGKLITQTSSIYNRGGQSSRMYNMPQIVWKIISLYSPASQELKSEATKGTGLPTQLRMYNIL